ncbi:hypothetical protein, partial [Embleya sp. NPDC005971]|uniref:hypothetical protein n=1 Tax=Embleya sp. NPDC005971 TaxID=3156724 RepID=UPI0033FB0407
MFRAPLPRATSPTGPPGRSGAAGAAPGAVVASGGSAAPYTKVLTDEYTAQVDSDSNTSITAPNRTTPFSLGKPGCDAYYGTHPWPSDPAALRRERRGGVRDCSFARSEANPGPGDDPAITWADAVIPFGRAAYGARTSPPTGVVKHTNGFTLGRVDGKAPNGTGSAGHHFVHYVFDPLDTEDDAKAIRFITWAKAPQRQYTWQFSGFAGRSRIRACAAPASDGGGPPRLRPVAFVERVA